ncbi:MAG: hypothetical protein KAH23_00235 [Kiritimatiellae bacterium]|nr:hypothetical protein [Kiritimatiellia bacterium]
MNIRNIAGMVLKKTTDNAKLLIAALLILCVVALMISMVGTLFSRGSDVDIPNFSVLKERFKLAGADGVTMDAEDFSAMKAMKSVKKNYEKKIDKLIKKRSLVEADASTITDQLVKVDKEYRSAYLSGLSDFIAAAQKFNKKQGDEPEIDIGSAVDSYASMFDKSLKDAQKASADSSKSRARFLHVARGSVSFLVLLLIVALLLKIAGTDESPVETEKDETTPEPAQESQ